MGNDKTFNAREAAENEKRQPGFYKTLTWQERLIVANYLNSIKYNYPENEPQWWIKRSFQ